MADKQPDAESLLFESLQGDAVTDEQLNNWDLLNSQIDDLILDPFSEEKDINLALLLSASRDKNEVEVESSTSAATSAPTSASDTPTKSGQYQGVSISHAATTKFLKGELNFLQFSELMEKMTSEGTATQAGHSKSDQRQSVVENDDPPSWSEGEDLADMTWIPTKKKKPRKPRRRKHDIPKNLVGLMGEANLQYAHGNSDEAMKMCYEIIRLAPMSSEPFRMLAMIYEEMNDTNKSLQFSLIAAHLQPNDPEEWVRLAQLSLEMGEPKQALTCYTKASKYDNTNLTLVLEKCHLLESLGQDKKALETYIQVLKCLPGGDGSNYFILARNLCRTYHESGRDNKAIEALTIAFDMHPQEITSEDVNHLVELQMSQKAYQSALLELKKNCAIKLYDESGEELMVNTEKTLASQSTNINKCEVSELLALDLRVKLIVCLLHLGIFSPVDELVMPLYDEDWEENGDVHLDVAEAYMEAGLYQKAQPILHRLVTHTHTYTMAAVWLRYGECLNAVGEVTAAMEAYKRVVTLAPNHVAARVALSALQQQLGRPDEAIQTLSKDEDSADDVTESEVLLLMHKCHVLYAQEKWDCYLESCRQVVLCHIPEKSHTRMKLVSAAHGVGNKRKALRSDECPTTTKGMVTMKSVSKIELFDLYQKASTILLNQKNYSQLLDFSLCAMTNPAFIYDTSISLALDEMAMNACLLKQDSVYGYKYIRNLCVLHPDKCQVWNLFSQMLQYSHDSRHSRFCLRLMNKYPSNVHLNILNGHISTISGSYKHALGEYAEAYKQRPDDPLVCLCMGLTFLHMSIQKYATQRHWIIAQGMAFLSKYVEKRGDCQEVYYNMGRAMHQLGVLHVATFYYKKALAYGPAITSEPEVFDMNRQIAFNLALLYRNNGCVERAHILLQQYCVM